MESEIFRQAKEEFLKEMNSDSDGSDECRISWDVMCESADMDYSFPRRGSLVKRDVDSKCSQCSSCLDTSPREDPQDHKDVVCQSHKLKWADECNKELARRNPRKRYTKKPLRMPPLKPILKAP